MKRILIEGFILALIAGSMSLADPGEHRHREGFEFPEYRYHNPDHHEHRDHDNNHGRDSGC